ncbi:MAG: family transposase, partial [Limisphaerales bacterium]
VVTPAARAAWAGSCARKACAPAPAAASIRRPRTAATTAPSRPTAWPPAEAVVRPVVRQVIRSLQTQIAKLDAQLAATLQADPELHRQAQRLRTIPAVGPVLCAGLLAELPADLRDARAATAYAGLNPRHRESGSRVRGRTSLSKIGNARLRRLLYVPALAGLQYNPVLRAQAQRLAARGKTGKILVGALMRKLLCLCVGVLRSGQPWNPTGRPNPTTSGLKPSP